MILLVNQFISKPINGIELRARIHSMLRIKQQYDDLQNLIQLREDMVSMIVHDLRNPLASILREADYAETGGAIIRVADSGPGVSATYRQHIFEKFEIGTLVKDATQIVLGLAFCKMAIDAHGGQIAIEDNQPRGTMFRVLLPSSVSQ